MKLTGELSQNSAPGSREFMSKLQIAITTLWKGLSVMEQENYAVTATEWNEKVPPNFIQSR
jgi:hypothetical protein